MDDLSSAHVYVRLPQGKAMENIPADTQEDCCQLVKANSIQGNKMNNIVVVFTPWSNLKKTGDMAVGQVGGCAWGIEKACMCTRRACMLACERCSALMLPDRDGRTT